MTVNTAIAIEPDRVRETIETGTGGPIPGSGGIDAVIARACSRIAPLWPLKHFVAVNPFLGFTAQTFAATCAMLRRVAGIDMLMARPFYRRALMSGLIQDQDLEAALAAAPRGWAVPVNQGEFTATLARDRVPDVRSDGVVATVAEVLDRLAAGDRQSSRTAFMVDEISKWCAAYFDEGQAAWQMPWRSLRPYMAWRAAMRHDLNPAAMGIKGFRSAIAGLPEDPVATIAAVVERLGIPERAVEDYLHRALLDIGGWAAHARYRVWENALHGCSDDTLVQLLAIRLAWGYALFTERTDAAFAAAWRQALGDAAALPADARLGDDRDLAVDLVMQEAYETAYQRWLVLRLARHCWNTKPQPSPARKLLQAAFCIDVRSEVYRRALETVCPEAETIGFAGFFGFPIEYVRIGHMKGGAQCPVLLKPSFVVCEAVDRAADTEDNHILALRLLRRRVAKAWKAFKVSAVSSFTYVETVGPMFAGKILGDSLGITRTVNDPATDGLDASVIDRLGPRIDPHIVDGRLAGFPPERRVDMAEAVLRAMSLTADFARLVVLTGHGSTSVNNPYASGLDCGACGGHTGEANARVAAAVLNDPQVRAGLEGRGIHLPSDTWFLAALHDTTTDEVRVFGADALPPSHEEDLSRLHAWLAQASALARLERAELLGLTKSPNVNSQVIARSRDWSQVRPEWGLAGNSAFIAAPRARTHGLNLQGRVFLHDYDWRQDKDGSVLELIMTAPMIVASWINLQYYGSTVNNRTFGSGNKVLHNVVGALGALEGNAGDLKVGLPWQSVHDGRRFIHEPLRLNVFIESPRVPLDRVIAAHADVRDLIDHGWLHLFRIGEDDLSFHRYLPGQRWQALCPSK